VPPSLSGCGYSTLQQQDEDVKASWSEVVSLYQRRADLISPAWQAREGSLTLSRSSTDPSECPHGLDAGRPGVLSDPAAFASTRHSRTAHPVTVESLGVSAGTRQLQSDPISGPADAARETKSDRRRTRQYNGGVRNFNTWCRHPDRL